MAGEWIKMRNDLSTSPKVVRIASALQADRLRVIGGLHAVWCLFDVHSEDGVLDGYNAETLDESIGWSGFSRSLITVGWLLEEWREGTPYLCVPRFDEHNGQSAKRRAQEAQRKRTDRRNASASDADKKRTRGEKSRSIKPPTPLPGGFVSFWNAWPQHHRKAGKPQCLRKWETKGCEAFAPKVVSAVLAYAKSEDWTKEGGKYIPAPAAWLNQEKWDAPQQSASITVPSTEAERTAEYLRSQQLTEAEKAASLEAKRRALQAVKRVA